MRHDGTPVLPCQISDRFNKVEWICSNLEQNSHEADAQSKFS